MKKFKAYTQRDSMDCGPTCLRMVCAHYGRNIPAEILREAAQIGKDGVNILGISEAAEQIGFRTQSVRISLNTLSDEAKLPAILHWNQNHFVVLYKVKRQKYFIADPAIGIVEQDRNEFLQSWRINNSDHEKSGIALLLEPTPVFYAKDDPDDAHNTIGIKHAFRYLLPHRKLVLQLLLGLALASLMQLILPFLTQSIVDVGINNRNIQFVYLVLFAQLALFVGRISLDFIRSWTLLHISTRINISILTDFIIKLMKLPVSFFDSKKTGDILQRMNDHKRIESFLTGSSINILFSSVNLIIFSIVLAMFNHNIFFVFLLSSALYALWVFIFLKKVRQLDIKRFQMASAEQSNAIQMIQGMQEIKLNGLERSMRWNWERLQARSFRLKTRGLALHQWQQNGAMFINESKNIFITFLSATAVIDGQMTLGAMLAVQYIIGQLNSPIEQLLGFIQNLQNAKISLERLNEIHKLEDEEPSHKGLLQELPRDFQIHLAGGKAPVDELVFQNTSFTYPGAGIEPVLRNIDLAIPRGKTTAIVGVSGSGKTTLLKLLLKFYDPEKGEIILDRTPLAKISHATWRKNCGVVMQESFIFSDTIARNIAVSEEKIDRDKLNHAVRVANATEFINSLPLGFNTKIGAEGIGISMGQRQRILIARAVYRDPEFIFFDEATNSLDANNESAILQNLQEFFRGKTVVVVAHRLSTVRKADQIVVLHKGMITEKGTHEELVKLQGNYFTLVKNQLELGG